MWTIISITTIKNIKKGILLAKNNPDVIQLEPIYTVLNGSPPESDNLKIEIKSSMGNRMEKNISKERLIKEQWHFLLD